MHLPKLLLALAATAGLVGADRYTFSDTADQWTMQTTKNKRAYSAILDGPAFHAFSRPDPAYPGLVRMYELGTWKNGNWLYTTNQAEVDQLAPPGQTCGKAGCDNPWSVKREQIYVFPGPHPGTVPLYRFYKPQNYGYHFFSGDINEGPALGYALEGIAAYVFPTAVPGSTVFYRWRGPDTRF